MLKVLKILGIFLLAFIFIKVCFPYYRVQTSSMEPTIKKGQHIIVSRLQYLLTSPQKNDIVLFKPVKGIFEKGEWIHRIIANEGDKVSISGGVVKVNDELA